MSVNIIQPGNIIEEGHSFPPPPGDLYIKLDDTVGAPGRGNIKWGGGGSGGVR